MSTDEVKRVFASRLSELRREKGITQSELAEVIGVGISTVCDWEKAKKMARGGAIQKLAEYFEVDKSFLFTDDHQIFTNKELKKEKDIAKRIDEMMADLNSADGLAFKGEPLTNEAKESLRTAFELIARQTADINKKYIPKKYRDEE